VDAAQQLAALLAAVVATVVAVAGIVHRQFAAQAAHAVDDFVDRSTLERVAAWFPAETPDAPESLPAKVDRGIVVADRALVVAEQTKADLLAHMTEENELRRVDFAVREQRQIAQDVRDERLDRLVEWIARGNPEVRRTVG